MRSVRGSLSAYKLPDAAKAEIRILQLRSQNLLLANAACYGGERSRWALFEQTHVIPRDATAIGHGPFEKDLLGPRSPVFQSK